MNDSDLCRSIILKEIKACKDKIREYEGYLAFLNRDTEGIKESSLLNPIPSEAVIPEPNPLPLRPLSDAEHKRINTERKWRLESYNAPYRENERLNAMMKEQLYNRQREKQLNLSLGYQDD